ncbi:MAG: RluA family pseudouridine synthase [Cyclobacteriaceae bacterium]
MQEQSSSFKSPSKKHQPKGLTIIYEDRDIIVVDKIQGLLTMGTDREKEKTAHFLLNEYVKKGNARSRNRVFIVHRLDRETSGILIFAKHEKAKLYLQDRWKDFSKNYFAVVHGKLPNKEGAITSYLLENKAFRVYSVRDQDKGKFSKTGYRVIKESDNFSLLEINLYTGRKHQIRVHLSETGHPVVGDKIYGPADREAKRLALHAASLTITHPFTHKEMSFETAIPPYFKTLVNYRGQHWED